MNILAIRTDKPEAELKLYEDERCIGEMKWEAHRELAATMHLQLERLLQDCQKNLHDIQAILVYVGPGSFTGLRIGIATANALAYANGLPIVGATGDDWDQVGIQRLKQGDNDKIAMPEYGAPVHITLPKR